jgi:hypothetical protein
MKNCLKSAVMAAGGAVALVLASGSAGLAQRGAPPTSTTFHTPKLPRWPGHSATSRDTMLFNNESRVEQNPGRGQRPAMEHVLKIDR